MSSRRPSPGLPASDAEHREEFPIAVFENSQSQETQSEIQSEIQSETQSDSKPPKRMKLEDFPDEILVKITRLLPRSDVIHASAASEKLHAITHDSNAIGVNPWAMTHRASNFSCFLTTRGPPVLDVIRYGRHAHDAPLGAAFTRSPIIKLAVSTCFTYFTLLLEDRTCTLYSFNENALGYSRVSASFKLSAWHSPVPEIRYFPKLRAFTICPPPCRLVRGTLHTILERKDGSFLAHLALDPQLQRDSSYRFASWQFQDFYFLAVRDVGSFQWLQLYRYYFGRRVTQANIGAAVQDFDCYELGSSCEIQVTFRWLSCCFYFFCFLD